MWLASRSLLTTDLVGSPEEGQGQKWGFRGTEEREGWSLQCKPEEDGNKHIPHFLTILNPFSFLSQRAELTSDKDMYLDNSSIEDASGVYPIDDDDYASASGSGTDEDVESPELTTTRPLAKIPSSSAAPKVETTTPKTQNKIPAQTKSPEEIDKEEEVHHPDSERKRDPDEEEQMCTLRSTQTICLKGQKSWQARPWPANDVGELWVGAEEETVIAGGVIGFLFAIFLILLLVYRMRKKDEGSYDLGERKPSSAAYQKAPTKEFYA
ncbi:hypothetical protein QTO34_007611 [Cnephaeus nilssonii]|uniref:Syndecan n=1 Tax=Cnephaeus nilssonii TaxID=3371016 RepID=A0AA40LHK6_CNENI|nr:hypothetical protein QTO34_007611 [Eptesicus nilssonii]